MANVSFLSLVYRLQTPIPEATLPHLAERLRQATVLFCERSESYTARIDPITTVAGVSIYDLDTPPETRVVKLLRLKLEGDALTPSSETQLDTDFPDWETKLRTPHWYFYRNRELTLAPVPPATLPVAVTGLLALKPTMTAQSIDEDFVEENLQALIDGALSLLYGESNRVWTSPSLAAYHKELYELAITDAVSKARQDHTAKHRLMPYGGL